MKVKWNQITTYNDLLNSINTLNVLSTSNATLIASMIWNTYQYKTPSILNPDITFNRINSLILKYLISIKLYCLKIQSIELASTLLEQKYTNTRNNQFNQSQSSTSNENLMANNSVGDTANPVLSATQFSVGNTLNDNSSTNDTTLDNIMKAQISTNQQNTTHTNKQDFNNAMSENILDFSQLNSLQTANNILKPFIYELYNLFNIIDIEGVDINDWII